LCYQYRAFGIPELAANPRLSASLVIAPYASMLGAMANRPAATENLRRMASNGWMGRYGFYESVDYTTREPVVVRSYMAHHQAMGLVALCNALCDGAMQTRFHADPLVLATEFVLQERVPALLEITEEQPLLRCKWDGHSGLSIAAQQRPA
jgi:hypothetical protein